LLDALESSQGRRNEILIVIADHLSGGGWSWGYSSQIDSTGRVLFTTAAHRDTGKRFIVSADEKLTAFLELERVTHDDSDRNQTATVWLGLAVSNGPSWMLHVLFNSPASK